MAGFFSRVKIQKLFAVISIVLGLGAGSYSSAQSAGDEAPYEAQQPNYAPNYAMSENELANLVAPIALYPDALLGQVLVACTYPDEVVEAQWWLEDNRNLSGPQLMEAAQQENWDPSVQALVAFPSVMALLSRDTRWTTELGNAFLAQQADVMNTIQNLRAEARENGELASTPQLSVNDEWQGDRSAIDIQPANPQRMFVPNYDPYAVWGAPAEGAYPELPYAAGSGFGSLIGTVANLAGLLPGFGGLLGPRSWGWALSWLAQTLFVNNSFFSDFGFHGDGGGGRGMSVWAHNGNRGFGGRYGGNTVAGWRGRGSVGRGGQGWNSFARSRIGPDRNGRESSARYQSSGGQNFRGQDRAASGNNWRQFGGNGRNESSRGFERTGVTASRSFNRGMQPDYRGGRNSYSANSAGNRGGSFAGSRSFESGSRYSGFANSANARRGDSSRTFAGQSSGRSWGSGRGQEPRVSAARISSGRESSFGRDSSSRHGSWGRGSSSHSFKQPKAPKYKAPHYAKAHGGGHSSGGHFVKKSHRG